MVKIRLLRQPRVRDYDDHARRRSRLVRTDDLARNQMVTIASSPGGALIASCKKLKDARRVAVAIEPDVLARLAEIAIGIILRK